jgi:hypothetical protein
VDGLSTVLFAAHVDVTALAQNEESQGRERHKSQCNFPHDFLSFLNKKAPVHRRGPPDDFVSA